MMMNRYPIPSTVRQISTHPISALCRRVINHATGCAFLVITLLLAVPQQSSAQQCEPQWSDEWSTGDPFEAVKAMTVFDDGTGPALYVCDYNSLWKWDGSDWTQLCRGGGDFFFSLAVHDDGSGAALYLGGSFQSILVSGAQVIEANNIVKWDGASWSALGDGVSSHASITSAVKSLQSFDDGSGPSLYVGGSFDTAGKVPAQNIASWDGQQWWPLGRGVVVNRFEPVLSMAVFDDGSGNALYVGGDFIQAGTLTTNSIARWEGDVWSEVGDGFSEDGDTIRTMTVFDDGSGPALVVGGQLTDNWRGHNMAKWDGTAWTEMLGVNRRVNSLHVQSEGGNETLYIGGHFTWIGDPSSGEAASGIGAYDGKSWFSVAQGVSGTSVSKGNVQSIISFDDGSGPALIAGGSFSFASGAVVSNIAKWDQIEWAPLSEPRSRIVGYPVAMATLDDGNGQALYVGITHHAGSVELGGVGKFDGEDWTPLGMPFQWATIYDFEMFDDGTGSRLFAAGNGIFQTEDTLIASYNGTGWDTFPQTQFAGINSMRINAMTVFDDGSGSALYIGGTFDTIDGVVMNNLAKWDGTSWSPLLDEFHIGVSGEVKELLVFDDGSGPALFPVGLFGSSGGSVSSGIAKWDASGWTPVLGLPASGHSAAVFDDGTGPKIYVADRSDVFKWDGTWDRASPSINTITRLRAFDDGSGAHLYVTGAFRHSVPDPFFKTGLLKLVNGQWDPNLEELDGFAFNLAVFNDSLYVAGAFTQAGEIQTGPLARLIGCPPECKADCDQSTGVGVLDIFDFLCFQNSFVNGEPYACDCDTSTGKGVCDIFDFLCFQNAFVAGCP